MLGGVKRTLLFSLLCGVASFTGGRILAADATTASAASTAPDTRYGLFDGLDHRSAYGQGAYPEPFLVDDSDLETAEARLDWVHTAVGADHSDNFKGEVEYGFGLLTAEIEVPWERDVEAGSVTKGFDNIDVGARYPFYQFVSQNGWFDSTFGAGVEVGIPTLSDVSHNAELVPKVFDDVKIGNFTMQSIFGYSMLFGPGEEGGVDTFEYGFTFGYTIPHATLPLPGVDRLIPVFEMSGETQLNQADSGHNRLLGEAGLRVNLKSIGRIQPRPGVVFIFPVDNGAREETHWGIMTSLVFEF
jgi:hypothetical protein